MDVQGSMVPRRSDGSVDDEVASNTSKDDQREAWRQIEGGPTVPSTSTLCGTLKKRHAAEKSLTMQWGKRYFFVDDKRGLLQYSKNAKQIMTKPSMMIPLADIVAVETLTGGVVGILPNCFTIEAPPTKLVLRADDKEDLTMWTVQLRLRIEVWKKKRAEQPAGAGAEGTSDDPARALEAAEARPAARGRGGARPRLELRLLHEGHKMEAPFTLKSCGVTVWSLGEIHREEWSFKYWSSKGCLFHHAYPVGYR